jgi:hypothetical protein
MNGLNGKNFTSAGIRDGRQNASKAIAEDLAFTASTQVIGSTNRTELRGFAPVISRTSQGKWGSLVETQQIPFSWEPTVVHMSACSSYEARIIQSPEE